jgi:hypothetical protein
VSLDPATTFRQLPGCEISEMPDGLVIYQADQELVHYLNPTASLIYSLCGDDLTVEAIAVQLQDAFTLPERPSAEVIACLDDLVGKGLIAPC